MNTDMSALLEIDWPKILPLVLPIILFNLLLIGVALYDWYKRKVLILSPYIWLIIILLLQLLGPILYLVIGRRMIRNDYSGEAS